MAKRAGQAVVHSTMYAAMNGDTLPKLDVVKAIIVGCGGGEDDLSSFASAWRRIASGRAGTGSLHERSRRGALVSTVAGRAVRVSAGPRPSAVNSTRTRVVTARRPWRMTTGSGKFRSGGTIALLVSDGPGAATARYTPSQRAAMTRPRTATAPSTHSVAQASRPWSSSR